MGIYYLGAAGLGFATGSVETFEPVLTSTLVKSSKLSSGLGWLSSSRALGLFVSNVVVGVLFVFGQFDSYLFAALTAFVAGAILLAIELKTKVRLDLLPNEFFFFNLKDVKPLCLNNGSKPEN